MILCLVSAATLWGKLRCLMILTKISWPCKLNKTNIFMFLTTFLICFHRRYGTHLVGKLYLLYWFKWGGQLSCQLCKLPVYLAATLATIGWLHIDVLFETSLWFEISWWKEIAVVLLLPILKWRIIIMLMTARWWEWHVFLSLLPKNENSASSVGLGFRF